VNRTGKLIFADQLRAIAALSVIIVHLLGVYWAARDDVARHIFAPALAGPSARSLQLISPTYFNFGPFGVSLFFVISGFVIPFSVAKTGKLRFLAARALRIYPTYAVCLSLSLFSVWLSSRFWGRPFDWGVQQVLNNALLIANVTGIDSIDMVNWSLAIEIKFYLFACVMAPWIARSRIAPVLLSAIGLALFVSYAASWIPPRIDIAPAHGLSIYTSQFAHDLLFIPFMLAGTMFSYHFRGQISTKQLLSSIACLFGIFIVAWPHTVLKDQFPLVPLNYFYALCVFGIAYAYRHRFRAHKAIDGLAAISYPVYALHSLVGYVAIRFLTASGINYYFSVGLAVLLVAGLAYAVHRIVELPTQNLGKRLMKSAPPLRKSEEPALALMQGHHE
jgi:peptidoglycan/LPS O-acetylase OafA/YrhL